MYIARSLNNVTEKKRFVSHIPFTTVSSRTTERECVFFPQLKPANRVNEKFRVV